MPVHLLTVGLILFCFFSHYKPLCCASRVRLCWGRVGVLSEWKIAFVDSLTSPWFKSPPRFVISMQSANSLGGCVKPPLCSSHCTSPSRSHTHIKAGAHASLNAVDSLINHPGVVYCLVSGSCRQVRVIVNCGRFLHLICFAFMHSR